MNSLPHDVGGPEGTDSASDRPRLFRSKADACLTEIKDPNRLASHSSNNVKSFGGRHRIGAVADSGRLQAVSERFGLMKVEFDMEHGGHDDERVIFRSRANWVLIGFLAIGGFFLLTEHRAHLIPYLGYLPFLLILACPLMHLFMHGGHGGHGARNGSGRGSTDAGKNQPHQH